MFGVDQSSTPLKKPDGSLTFSGEEKAKLLSDHFNSKMSREEVDVPSGCFPLPKLTSIAFRSSEIEKILQNLDAYGGVDSNGLFPNFFKRFSHVFAPKLAALFRNFVHSGTFPTFLETCFYYSHS